MFEVLKPIFIKGTPYQIGEVVEVDSSTASLLLTTKAIKKAEVVKEVSIKSKRTRKEK